MVIARIYIEGGGDSKELHSRCREGFRRLLENCGFSGRMPRLIACGGRSAAFDDFKTAHRIANSGTYVAIFVDSEDRMDDIEKTWKHLHKRDGWDQPNDADDEQVLLMVTCMETWITVDRSTLRTHYGDHLREAALPVLTDVESRGRHAIQDSLVLATNGCKNAYAKGKRSFEVVGKLNPNVLRQHLPSFVRCERVLRAKL